MKIEIRVATSKAELYLIDDEISKGRPVVVHCNGGRGRTGTLLAAYFMKKEGLTAKQALTRVREKRGRAPRREKQLKALSDYENYLSLGKHDHNK